MKNTTKSTIAALALIMTAGCKEVEKPKPEAAQAPSTSADRGAIAFSHTETEDQWIHYLALKDALVRSDAAGAQMAAARLSKHIQGNADFKSLSEYIAEEAELEKQRMAFFQINEIAEQVFREDLKAGTIYKQYCPMAFNNTGGPWLSDAGEIRNPYFGDRMLKCGTVQEVISD